MCSRRALIAVVVLLFLYGHPTTAFGHVPHDVVSSFDISSFEQAGQVIVVLFAVVRDSLLRSLDGGSRWKSLVNGLDNRHRFTSVAISPSFGSDGTVLAATEGDGIYKSSDRGDSWDRVSLGPSSASINMVSLSPQYPCDGAALAAPHDGGLIRSLDGGSTWSPVAGLSARITAVVFFPRSGKHILAGDQRGKLYLSTDGANSWNYLGRTEGGAIKALAVSPTWEDDATFYVGTERNTSFQVPRLLRHRGASFQTLALPFQDEGITSIACAINPNNDHTLFVTTWREAVFRSNDRGQNWEKCAQGVTSVSESKLGRPRPDFQQIKASNHFHRDRTLYLGGFDGLFRSVDEGKTWSSLETISIRYIDGLAISPDYFCDGMMAINTYGAGVYVTEDRGHTWRIANRGLRSIRGVDIAFSPHYRGYQTLFNTRRIGSALCVRSDDGGRTWQQAHLAKSTRGLFQNYCVRWFPRRWRNALASGLGFEPTAIALSPAFTQDATVFIGGIRGQIFKSIDGGLTFACIRRRWGRTSVKCLSVSPNYSEDRTVFAALGNFDISRVYTRFLGIRIRTGDAVIKTVDGGETWHRADNGLPIDQGLGLRLAISPDYGSDCCVCAATAFGLYKTTDGGMSWTRARARSRFGPDCVVDSVALSPKFGVDGEMLVQVRGKGLFKSRDKGNSFEPVAPELIRSNHSLSHMFGYPGFGLSLLYSQNYQLDGTIVGSSTEELFISRDRGLTWSRLNRPIRYEDGEQTRKVLSFEGPDDWEQLKNDSFSMGSVASSSIAGSRAVFHFVGRKVTWIGSRGHDQGIADVYLDGEFQAKVDQFAPAKEFAVELFTADDLKSGPHTLIVSVTGARNPQSRGDRVEVDAFDIMTI